MTDYKRLLQVPRATKDRLEEIAEELKNYTLIYSIDTNELGVKLSDGTITYFGVLEELEWANILNKPTFATVAETGSYEDLEDLPDEYELTKPKIDTALKGTGTNSIQLGEGATSEGASSTAVGRNTSALGDFSTALGNSASTSGLASTALGQGSSASGQSSTAVGRDAKTEGDNSTALGYNASASADYSTALGHKANAQGDASTALGYDAYATGSTSTAVGVASYAAGIGSTALGSDAYIEGEGSTGLGQGTSADGISSTAVGQQADASGDYSIALGHEAKAKGENSIAIGSGTEVTEDNVVDFGESRQVRVNKTPEDNRDAVSKKYLEDNTRSNTWTPTWDQVSDKPDLLDKDFSTLDEQTNPLLSDVLVLNRGTVAQKVTLAKLLAHIDTEIFIVVSALPTTGAANKIYLVPSDDPESIDNYVEWLWHDDNWERLGGFTLDLSNYYNKTDVDSMLGSKVDKNADIAPGKYPKITYDKKGLVTGGEALDADDIPNLNASKINAGTFAAARIPNLAPTKITQNATNRFVTDAEKDYWDAKQDKLVRVRIFNEQDELITIQMIHEGESLKELDKQGYLFDYGTRNEFDYNTTITEDLDLTYSEIPPRYIQTTSADFDSNGNYTGTEEYIILPEDKPSGYKIQNINVKGVATNGDYLTNCQNMFFMNNSLYLELDYLNTSNVTTMNSMFGSSQATTLDLSNFDTSNVSNMNAMFAYSQSTTLDLSSFDTSNVTNMNSMFSSSQATTFDLSSFDTSNVTNMANMFQYSQATELDLSSFDTSNVINLDRMFSASQATIGYARTNNDAYNFMVNSSYKPSTLTFVVKENYTSTEKTKLAGIQAGAQVNTVTSVAGKTGAVTLAPNDIPNLNASKINTGEFAAARIPNLAPGKITQNETNRFVTDIEKAYWNGKVDADGGDL